MTRAMDGLPCKSTCSGPIKSVVGKPKISISRFPRVFGSILTIRLPLRDKAVTLGAWLGATRPLTLVASVVPVVVGTTYSWRQTAEISWAVFVLCLSFAVLMQIGANFANDYYDFRRGADTRDRLGPTRAVASGIIRPQLMKTAAFGVLALGFSLGLALLWISNGGWPLLCVGVASVVCAWAYTSGPWPLAYVGLGDLFVILFFGLVAVLVTHFVQLRSANLPWVDVPWIPALGVGLVINNLLLVNNHRDAETDRRVGKLTLVARFGKYFGVFAYLTAIVCSMLVFPIIEEGLRGTLCLCPLGLFVGYRLSKARSARHYAFVFAGTVALVLFYGAIVSAWNLWFSPGAP